MNVNVSTDKTITELFSRYSFFVAIRISQKAVPSSTIILNAKFLPVMYGYITAGAIKRGRNGIRYITIFVHRNMMVSGLKGEVID